MGIMAMVDAEDLPQRFCPAAAWHPLSPTNEKRTALAKLQQVRPASRNSTKSFEANTEKAAAVRQFVVNTLRKRSQAEVEKMFLHCDGDRDGKLSRPQLRGALSSLLVDLSDIDFAHLWSCLDSRNRGIV